MSNSDDFQKKKLVAGNVELILSGKVVDLMMELNRDDAVKLLISWVNTHAFAGKIAALRDVENKEGAVVIADAMQRLQESYEELKNLGMDLSNETMNEITEEAGGKKGMWGSHE